MGGRVLHVPILAALVPWEERGSWKAKRRCHGKTTALHPAKSFLSPSLVLRCSEEAGVGSEERFPSKRQEGWHGQGG